MLATGGVLPDLTLVLDLDPVVGMRRIRDRALDAFEKMDLAFHRRVREGYLEIAHSDKNRVVVLDAGREPEVLHADVVRSVDECLARRGGGRERQVRHSPDRCHLSRRADASPPPMNAAPRDATSSRTDFRALV